MVQCVTRARNGPNHLRLRAVQDNVTVFARSLLHGDVLAKQDVSIVGDLTVDGEAEIRND